MAAVLLVVAGTAHAEEEEKKEATTDDEADASGPVVGLELGVAWATGTSHDSYGLGVGKTLVLGWRMGRLTFEWHLLGSYRSEARDANLRGDATAGELTMTSLVGRVLLFGPAPLVWLGGGIAEIGVPLVAAAHLADDGSKVQPRAMNANGLGPVASAALGFAVPGGVLTVEGRVFVPILWELPEAYLTEAGTASTNDDVHGLAVSVTLGYRLAL